MGQVLRRISRAVPGRDPGSQFYAAGSRQPLRPPGPPPAGARPGWGRHRSSRGCDGSFCGQTPAGGCGNRCPCLRPSVPETRPPSVQTRVIVTAGGVSRCSNVSSPPLRRAACVTRDIRPGERGNIKDSTGTFAQNRPCLQGKSTGRDLSGRLEERKGKERAEHHGSYGCCVQWCIEEELDSRGCLLRRSRNSRG